MALFIRVEVSPAVAGDANLSAKLVEVCPVNIFATDSEGKLQIVEGNLDECTLCELCLQAAPPQGLRVVKLYDETATLES